MVSNSEIKELFEQKQKQRVTLKNEYWKQITNPHRHGTGDGGHLFDPAIQRYMSMKVTSYNFFKPTPKTSILGFLLLVVPTVGYMYIVKSSRDKQEAKYRSGLVAYKDRNFKFI